MNANELRIGNYYQDRFGNCHKIETLSKSIFVDEYYDRGTPIGAMIPIPLTEEILLKAGFEKNDYTRFPTFKLNRIEITNVEFFDEDKDGKEFSFKQWRISGLYSTDLFYFKSYSPNIESVHQLQNLFFALTGEEIKIEL